MTKIRKSKAKPVNSDRTLRNLFSMLESILDPLNPRTLPPKYYLSAPAK